jgi:hypothetical protein
MNPTINLDIRLPNANEETKNLFKSAIGTEEEKNNEVIALLFAGYFIPTNSSTTASSGYSTAGAGAAGYNGIEFLSNQLSQKLSQIAKDFDIGVNYRPADQITTDMVALALSTQVVNDRIIVNGNVDVGGRPVGGPNSNSSNIVGEGNIEYKVTPNGKLRIKAFNRSNESYIENLSPYTQGVGVTYKENFNSFGNLLKRYYQLIFTRKENKNKPVEEEQSKDQSKNEPENNVE